MDIVGRIDPLLHLSDAPLLVTTQLAAALLAAFAVTACIWSNFSLVLLGRSSDVVQWLLRFGLCISLLGAFDDIFFFSVQTGAVVAQQIQRTSPSASAPTEILLESGKTSQKSGLAAEKNSEGGSWARAGMSWISPMAWVATTTKFFIYVTSELLVVGAALCLTLLRVLGPLMIAAGIFANSATIIVLFRNLLWISIWPIIPACISLILSHEFDQQRGDNGAFMLAQGIIFSLGTLFTPYLSNLLLGSSGLERAASWGSNAAFQVISQGAHSAERRAAKAASRAFGAMASAYPSGGFSGMDGSGLRDTMSVRPGDTASAHAAQQGLGISEGSQNAT